MTDYLRKILCIRSLIGCDLLRNREPFSALPHRGNRKRYTKIYFGENQLSPGSFGMLPLTSSHPMLLLQQRVRASLFLSKEFTLLKVSSPGFGSIPYSGKNAQLEHAFTPPSQLSCLDYKV